MTQTSDGATRCHWPLWESHVNLSIRSRGRTIVHCHLTVLRARWLDFRNRVSLQFPLPRIFPLFETQHTSWPSKNSTKCSRKQRVPGVVTIVRLYHSYSTCRGDRTDPSGHPLFSRSNNSVTNVFHYLRSNFSLFLVCLNLLYDTFNDRAILFLYVKSCNIFPGWSHAGEEEIIVIENEDEGTCHEAYSIRSGLMQICSIDIKLHPSRPDWVRI